MSLDVRWQQPEPDPKPFTVNWRDDDSRMSALKFTEQEARDPRDGLDRELHRLADWTARHAGWEQEDTS